MPVEFDPWKQRNLTAQRVLTADEKRIAELEAENAKLRAERDTFDAENFSLRAELGMIEARLTAAQDRLRAFDIVKAEMIAANKLAGTLMYERDVLQMRVRALAREFWVMAVEQVRERGASTFGAIAFVADNHPQITAEAGATRTGIWDDETGAGAG